MAPEDREWGAQGGDSGRASGGLGQQAAHLAHSTEAGPFGGLGAAPGYHRPRKKDWCLDKDWFQELWASESLSVTPNVFSAQGVHTAPITQLRTVHLPVICPLRGLPSYDPLAATVGTQTPGMEPGDSPGQRSQPPCGPTCHHPQVPTIVHLWVPYSALRVSGSKDHGRLAPQSRCIGATAAVSPWGCSGVTTHFLQLSQPNSLTQ